MAADTNKYLTVIPSPYSWRSPTREFDMDSFVSDFAKVAKVNWIKDKDESNYWALVLDGVNIRFIQNYGAASFKVTIKVFAGFNYPFTYGIVFPEMNVDSGKTMESIVKNVRRSLLPKAELPLKQARAAADRKKEDAESLKRYMDEYSEKYGMKFYNIERTAAYTINDNGYYMDGTLYANGEISISRFTADNPKKLLAFIARKK